MKRFERPQSLRAVLLASSLFVVSAELATGKPLLKVIDMIGSLRSEIKQEGVMEAKTYDETMAWCRETELSTKNNIKLGIAAVEKAKATIAEAIADTDESSSKIDELAASIASDSSELKKASSLRGKEAAEFQAAESELLDTIDAIARTLTIIGTEMKKNPASLAQVDTSKMNSLLQTFGAVIDAAALPSNDKQKLIALIQDEQGDDLSDDSSVPAYKSKSGSIFEMLEDMREKAETQLSDLRKSETSAEHSYQMVKQSLETQIAENKKSLIAEKSAKAGAMEAKGVAEGDLTKSEAELSENKKTLKDLLQDCATSKEDYEAFQKGQAAELDALNAGEKAIKEAMSAVGGAAADIQVASNSLSLLQLGGHANLAKAQVLAMVKSLARKHHSAALAQLASRMKVLLRYGAHAGADPFSKVKDLITDMINKLEKEVGKEASEKAFCEKEMGKTKAKLEDLNSDISELDAKAESSQAREARLADSKKEVESEMAANAKEAAEMQALFLEEEENYKAATQELKAGLAGVRQAITVLREFYGHDAAFLQQSATSSSAGRAPRTAAGQGIIDMLEVIEDDLAKSLADEDRIYRDAKVHHEKHAQDFKVTRAANQKDSQYYGQQFLSQRKTTGEIEEDQDGQETEKQSVMEYYNKLKQRCVAEPGTYAAKKEQRQQEIAGLNQALAILDSETAFVQRGRRRIRGLNRHSS